MDGRPVPPLDGSINVYPGFTDFHHTHNPNRICAQFAADGSGEIVRISFEEFARATHRVARALRADGRMRNGEVVALIALCDTVMYMALLVGMVRAGLVPFPISPRNSAPAIHNMLSKTGCHRLLTTKAFLKPLLESCQAEFAGKGCELEIDEIPAFMDVYPLLGKETANDPFEPFVLEDWNPAMDDVTLYLHSSGSTGFPKPIPQTHRTVLHWCSLPCSTEGRYHPRELVWGAMMAPTFHTFGLYMQVYNNLVTGFSTAVFPPKYPAPPVIPTPENTLAALKATGSNTAIAVPSFFEAWAHSAEAIDFLATMEICTFAGGPLSAKAGNALVARGVKLNTTYGGTEFGAPSHLFDIIPENKAPGLTYKELKDWSWIRLSPRFKLRWVDQGDGTYELHMLTNENHQLSVENLPDTKGYATSDLWEKHPTIEGLWRLVGRTDDVLVLASGEKTVPSPMEGHILHNPLVQGTLMFGRGRDQVGILIEPHPAQAIDPKDEKAVIEFRNKIWPTVEEANKEAPAFSRIFKEMILVTDPARPMARAAKGTVMRKLTLGLYADEIDALYNTVESSMNTKGVDPPPAWTPLALVQWLSTQAEQINGGRKIDAQDDLFDKGFDSLSATFLRNRIIGALRKSAEPGAKQALAGVTQNIVYTTPTIVQLAGAVAALLRPESVNGKASPTDAIETMVEKYSAQFPKPVSPESPPGDGAVVLLTGSTGSLGSYILAALLGDDRVKRVYAFNRLSATSPTVDRQKAAFVNRGLSGDLLTSSKVVFVDGDASVPDLGLANDMRTHDAIRDSVTHVIHNAWRVDFNLALPSFDPNIRATRGLIDFALTSKHGAQVKFVFTSSITVAQAWDAAKGPFPEEIIPKPDAAIGGGYGEGKYVVERVLAAAAEETGLRSTSLRIGQICGGEPDGAWATTDWVPILVKSSLALSCLPDSQGTVSWLPMQAVARTVLDVGLAAGEPPLAVNVVHPRPVKWTDIMEVIRKALGHSSKSLALVSFSEWVTRLEKRAAKAETDDHEHVPAVRLLEFFRKLAAADAAKARLKGGEAGGITTFSTKNAQALSPTLGQLACLNERDAERWVGYWKSKAFI
ncbi:acetyl-CoA synthetase-like protein [Gloeophyllum trabeum ATCC 11539]|uniref:Acetyl-CoA synthetase-like protein n=1 Tax=Gloeophyllum trabeum (strain ATCC 11539 / FP-39264 / Madison 617) TaxID=670483 RepID=S7RWV1_GLOTA|nr:acetyl-CoA synthetase-like protein [Gloeophyllum trabeum ATCC 11539]EPQ57834.1 acetyl-CoA synthetase-like protein [Gloeophyllum trabeum ATCC 11539]